MGQSTRTIPVRADRWQPADRILDNVISRYAGAGGGAGQAADGGSELMAGAMILAMLALLIMVGAESVGVAVAVTGLAGGLGLLYVISRSGAGPADRRTALAEIGGPGGLPAGYLVHEGAWQAGMAGHVAYVPESQLQAAAQLCRAFPGTVDDLLGFTGSIAAHLPATRHSGPADVAGRARELVRIAPRSCASMPGTTEASFLRP
jgi:hypothetical protein